jgi:hypothetical protein
MKLRFALGNICRAKSWAMRSVADAKWSATRNSSVASCYQPSSCLVDDNFYLGSVSSAVKSPGDPRLPVAVCGHAASGRSDGLLGSATETDPLCQRRTPFRVGRRGDWVIRWQLPPDAICFLCRPRMDSAAEEPIVRRLSAGGRRIRTLGPSRREVLERSNISTRWILFQGGLRVRIRLPPPASPAPREVRKMPWRSNRAVS